MLSKKSESFGHLDHIYICNPVFCSSSLNGEISFDYSIPLVTAFYHSRLRVLKKNRREPMMMPQVGSPPNLKFQIGANGQVESAACSPLLPGAPCMNPTAWRRASRPSPSTRGRMPQIRRAPQRLPAMCPTPASCWTSSLNPLRSTI